MYSINPQKLAKELLNELLRKPIHTAWVELLVFPIHDLKDRFLAFVTFVQLQVSYNFQTQNVERMLNDKYPTASPDIYIEHTHDRLPRRFAFYASEDQDKLGTAYFESELQGHLFDTYFNSEYDQETDFIVKVPAALTYDEDEMKAHINKYKLAGKRYAIEVI
ncbi:MAG: hypothetical protein M3Q97_04315 [Bacteroidota bacterium]|nr:hypothetical protein [Bacteroidota bacterium]